MSIGGKVRSLVLVCICAAPMTSVANAAIAFTDDFETDLALWTGKDGGLHTGMIAADPLRAGNQVLTFTATQIGGDIFTASQLELAEGQTYIVSFEYLGMPGLDSTDGDAGGFAGLSEDTPGRHVWFYGSASVSGAADVLVDDGQWRSYSYTFSTPLDFFSGGGAGSNVRLMFEDFTGSGMAGDAFFDNVQLRAVPVPAAAWLFMSALGTLLASRKR